jgi:hypothetical protein
VVFFEGNYSHYEAKKKEEQGDVQLEKAEV